MGVLNITPNSFSDGNKFNCSTSFEQKFEELLEWSDIIDIGAESSAPNAAKISSYEEILRFKTCLFPYLKNKEDPITTLSIDTYKIETFKTVALEVFKRWPKTKIIFNDVSGSLDSELMELLTNFVVPFTYIYSHNNSPKRSETLRHMDFISKARGEAFIKELGDYFTCGIEKIRRSKRAFFIDPCFGFSKTREQNHTLLKAFRQFLVILPPDLTCVYGISKKSFLRFPRELNIKDKENLHALDELQAIFIFNLLRENIEENIIFRMHECSSLTSAKNSKKIFDI